MTIENKVKKIVHNEEKQIGKIEELKRMKDQNNFSEIASSLILSTEMKENLEQQSVYKSADIDVFFNKNLILEDKYTYQLLESFNFNESINLISAIEDSETLDGADSPINTEKMVTDFVINNLESYQDINLELLPQLKGYIASSDCYEKKSKIFIKGVNFIKNAQDWIFVNDNLLNSEIVDYCNDEDITDIIDLPLHPEALQVFNCFKSMENKYQQQIIGIITDQLSTLPRFTKQDYEIFFNKLKDYPYVFPHFYQTLNLKQQEVFINMTLLIDSNFWSKDQGFNCARDLLNAQKKFNQTLN